MKEMQVQFKPGYGLLAHNESIDGIADILNAFFAKTNNYCFPSMKEILISFMSLIRILFLKGKYSPIPIGYCLGKNLFPIGMVQITLPQN
ncbi:hypothetical protein X546_25175 [Brevibacillus borstelensis cifa_chp40]|nr:hypothetical protein X546_25175 [Brevibacillus borstelensis cifa_chp40]